MSNSNGIILTKFEENKVNSKKKSNKSFDITKIGISPCSYLDYLKCHKQNNSSIKKLISNTKIFMENSNTKNQKVKGGKIENSNSSEQDLQNKKEKIRVQQLRADAATAISYITSNFVLGKEEEVYKLRNYLRKIEEIEIDELILRFTHYIKNTK